MTQKPTPPIGKASAARSRAAEYGEAGASGKARARDPAGAAGPKAAGARAPTPAPASASDQALAAPAAAPAAALPWDGALEAVDAEWVLHGWAVAPGPAAPVVAVSMAGGPPVRAVADGFRRDMLAPPLRHGHHGFQLSLPAGARPGILSFTLAVAGLPGSRRFSLPVPPRAARPPLSMEAILAPPPRWGAVDLLAFPDPLDLNRRRIEGVAGERLIDALYLFVLERFPTKPEQAAMHAALLAGRLTPAEALRHLLTREGEFAARKSALLSPFDAAYPFTII